MKKIVQEKALQALRFVDKFRAFAMRGNVVDMAVGVIIGSAFSKVVSSVVKDLFMPPLGLLMGGINFTQLKVLLKAPIYSDKGVLVQEAVTLDIGSFFQTVFDFLIIAFSLFLVINAMGKMYAWLHLQEAEKSKAEEKIESQQEKLLREIRDILKQRE